MWWWLLFSFYIYISRYTCHFRWYFEAIYGRHFARYIQLKSNSIFALYLLSIYYVCVYTNTHATINFKLSNLLFSRIEMHTARAAAIKWISLTNQFILINMDDKRSFPSPSAPSASPSLIFFFLTFCLCYTIYNAHMLSYIRLSTILALPHPHDCPN